mmetsp:Transcript_5563/g.13941  ORF Transcript_5563/g.13941 Transcript_5563/m.13941 type:complete len:284 (+) Transcript_5563:2672-3523(+)
MIVFVDVFPIFREYFVGDHHRVPKDPFLVDISGVRQVFEEKRVPRNPPRREAIVAEILRHAFVVVVVPFDDPDQVGIVSQLLDDGAHRVLTDFVAPEKTAPRQVPAPAMQLDLVQPVVAVTLRPYRAEGGLVANVVVQLVGWPVVFGAVVLEPKLVHVLLPGDAPRISVVDEYFVSLLYVSGGHKIHLQSRVVFFRPLVDRLVHPLGMSHPVFLAPLDLRVGAIARRIVDERRQETVGTEQQGGSFVSETVIEQELPRVHPALVRDEAVLFVVHVFHEHGQYV